VRDSHRFILSEGTGVITWPTRPDSSWSAHHWRHCNACNEDCTRTVKWWFVWC